MEEDYFADKMNFKTFFLLIVILISLGMIVSSKELIFDTDQQIRISIDLVNSSGLWNESGNNIFPGAATLDLKIPQLSSCDTIDTDSDGVMSCGSDQTGSVSPGSNLNVSNLNASKQVLFAELIDCDTIDTDSEGVLSCGSDATGTGEDVTKFWNFANNDSLVLDNGSILRVGNLAKFFSNFGLENVSNNTPFAQVQNHPASSNFQLANVSNNTLVKEDNASVSLWNISGRNIFPRELNNRIGINTSNPSHMLTVIGNVLFNFSGSDHLEIHADNVIDDPIFIEFVPDVDSVSAFHVDIDINSRPNTFFSLIEYDLNDLQAEEEVTGILMAVDTRNAIDGDFFGLTCQKIGSNAHVTCLRVEPEADVLIQEQGVFVNVTDAFVNSTAFGFRNATINFSTKNNNTELFANDNDYVFIGSVAKFTDIRFAMNRTASNPGVKAVFEHSAAGDTWIQFGPTDATTGARESGIISWRLSDIEEDWTTGTVNGVIDRFWVRAQRTQNNLGTTPIEETIEISASTALGWNESGDVTLNDLLIKGTLKEGTLALSNLVYTGQIGIQFISGGQRNTDFNLGNISNYTQYSKSADFNIQNISNSTPFVQVQNHPAFSNFQLENLSVRLNNSGAQGNLNFTGNINITGILNASRTGGKLDCSLIDGGSDGDFCIDATTGGAAATGAGNTGNISYWTGENTLGNSTLFQLNGLIGLGTLTPTELLVVIGNVRISGNLNVSSINDTSLGEFNKSIDLSGYVTGVTSTAPVTSSGGQAPDIGITVAKDIVAGTGLSGGDALSSLTKVLLLTLASWKFEEAG